MKTMLLILFCPAVSFAANNASQVFCSVQVNREKPKYYGSLSAVLKDFKSTEFVNSNDPNDQKKLPLLRATGEFGGNQLLIVINSEDGEIVISTPYDSSRKLTYNSITSNQVTKVECNSL